MNEQFRFNSVLLNAELHSASTFIYDACLDILALEKNIQDMEAKLFNIFYKISIGIERFQKIIGVLNINPSSQEDLQNNCDELFYKHSHKRSFQYYLVQLKYVIFHDNPYILFFL